MNKAKKLRELFNGEGVIRIVGAHDGLRIFEKMGKEFQEGQTT